MAGIVRWVLVRLRLLVPVRVSVRSVDSRVIHCAASSSVWRWQRMLDAEFPSPATLDAGDYLMCWEVGSATIGRPLHVAESYRITGVSTRLGIGCKLPVVDRKGAT